MSEDDNSENGGRETRDVTDLSTNEQVEEEVDDMLGIPESERPDRDLSVPSDNDVEESSDDDGENEIRPEVREHMEEAQRRDEQAEEAGGTEVTVSSLEEPDEWEDFDFDGQDWTLDDAKEPEVRDIRGMKFKFEEPSNDDGVLNQLENASDGDQWEQMYALVRLVVTAPDVTRERWENMSFPSRLSLGSAAADYLGLDEGFLDE